MRFALIDNGVVVQVQSDPGGGFIAAPDYVVPGYLYDGGFRTPPEPAPPVPVSITPRQLWLGLLADGYITETEAEAASLGTLPAALDAAIAGLPAAERAAARISLRTMQEARRDDPLTDMLAATRGLTDADVDDAFRRWAAL